MPSPVGVARHSWAGLSSWNTAMVSPLPPLFNYCIWQNCGCLLQVEPGGSAQQAPRPAAIAPRPAGGAAPRQLLRRKFSGSTHTDLPERLPHPLWGLSKGAWVPLTTGKAHTRASISAKSQLLWLPLPASLITACTIPLLNSMVKLFTAVIGGSFSHT